MRTAAVGVLLLPSLAACFVDLLGEGGTTRPEPHGGGGGGSGSVGEAGAPLGTTTGTGVTASATTAVTSTASSSAAATTTGGPTQTCAEQYGASDGYSPCVETPTECHFGTIINYAASCTEVCAAGGGTCLDAYGNGVNGCDGSTLGCDFDDYYNLVCACSHDAP